MIINLPNILYTVSFDASAKTVVINGLGDVYAGNIKKIVNTTDNIVIYDDNDLHKLGTITANSISQTLTVVLDYDTTSMDDSDNIGVTYNADDDVLIFDALTAQSVYSISSSVTDIDVFLVAGQSNANGRGSASLSPIPDSGTAYQYYNNSISPAVDPVGAAISGSAWPSFAVQYYSMTGRKICFVPAGVSGASMYVGNSQLNMTWDVTGTLYSASISKVNSAISLLESQGNNTVFKGVLWSQGEADANDINSAVSTVEQYKSAFITMINNYKSYFNEHMPFYIFRTGTDTSKSDAGFLAVRNAQEEVANIINDTYIVFRNSLDFPSRSMMTDTVHYSQTGYNEMGRIGCEGVINRNKSYYIKTQTDKTGFGTAFPTGVISTAPNTTSLPVFTFGIGGSLTTVPIPVSLEPIDDGLYYSDISSSTVTRRKVATLSNVQTFTSTQTFNNILPAAASTYNNGTSTSAWSITFTNTLASNVNQSLILKSQTSTQPVIFQNASTEAARFSATNGNLLIATTTDALAADKLQVNGNVRLTTAGNKLKIATGSNASLGTATLSSGTITVSTTAVAAGSKIFTQLNTPGGTLGANYSVPDVSITAGTSFVINAVSSAGTVVTTDTSTINWWIIN